MFAQIKLYLYGLVAGLFALLAGYAKYQSSQKDKFKQRAKINEEKAESLDKRIDAHELREEIEETNAGSSADDIDARLHKYYRD